MSILLTGATGFIGSSVLDTLIASGHSVTAAVRSAKAAEAVAARGATPVVGDVRDSAWFGPLLDESDGAIHTAAPGDGSAPDFDRDVANTVVARFAGTNKPYVHTSGIWLYGSGDSITEETPFAPPALTVWRPGVESILTGADLRLSIVVPAIVYGDSGQGIPGAIASAERAEDGRLRLVGDGTQHWTTVHVDDLAALYVLAFRNGLANGYLIGANGKNPTVAEIGAAAAGAAGTVAETADASRARFGTEFADALLLDQQATGAKARGLGWAPSRASLIDTLSA